MDALALVETIDSVSSSTWHSIRRGEAIDQVYKTTPLMDKLVDNGRVREKVPEGEFFRIPIRHTRLNANRGYYSRGGTIGNAEQETLTHMLYDTTYLGTGIPRFFTDDIVNRGAAKILDYISELLDNAKMDLTQAFEEDLFVTNPEVGSINSLADLISSTPTTGSIAGFTRSSNTWTHNHTRDCSALTPADDLIDEMDRMFNLCSQYKAKGRKTVDVIVMGRALYQDLEKSHRGFIQIPLLTDNGSRRADLGFGNLKFKGAEIFWAPECPSDRVYFLNTDTIQFVYDPAVWFFMTKWKEGQNTLDRSAQIMCRGNLICDMFQKNGVMFNWTPDST